MSWSRMASMTSVTRYVVHIDSTESVSSKATNIYAPERVGRVIRIAQDQGVLAGFEMISNDEANMNAGSASEAVTVILTTAPTGTGSDRTEG